MNPMTKWKGSYSFSTEEIKSGEKRKIYKDQEPRLYN